MYAIVWEDNISPSVQTTKAIYGTNKLRTKRVFIGCVTTTHKSSSMILKFVGGKTHTHIHLLTLGRDGCVAMEICRLLNPALSPSVGSYLFYPSFIFSCSLLPLHHSLCYHPIHVFSIHTLKPRWVSRKKMYMRDNQLSFRTEKWQVFILKLSNIQILPYNAVIKNTALTFKSFSSQI